MSGNRKEINRKKDHELRDSERLKHNIIKIEKNGFGTVHITHRKSKTINQEKMEVEDTTHDKE